jgi:hypothetical protein
MCLCIFFCVSVCRCLHLHLCCRSVSLSIQFHYFLPFLPMPLVSESASLPLPCKACQIAQGKSMTLRARAATAGKSPLSCAILVRARPNCSSCRDPPAHSSVAKRRAAACSRARQSGGSGSGSSRRSSRGVSGSSRDRAVVALGACGMCALPCVENGEGHFVAERCAPGTPPQRAWASAARRDTARGMSAVHLISRAVSDVSDVREPPIAIPPAGPRLLWL